MFKRKLWVFKEKSLMLIQSIFAHIFYLFLKRKIKGEKETSSKIVVGFSNLYYNGNPRAVFEYMKQFPDEYECFWVAKNMRSYQDVKKDGGRVYYMNSIVGMSHFIRTDVWIIAHVSIRDIPSLPHKNYKVIQLWHGAGGPKGVKHTKEGFEKYSAWCVPSEYLKQRYMEVYNAPLGKLYVTGFARMDTLYEHLEKPKGTLLNEIKIKNERKIILYAPTFDVGLWPWGNAYEEFEKLCKFCKENNLILILRLHPYAEIKKGRIKKIIKKYENIYWLDMSREPDTMKLLAVSDILITAWSSISTDYLLTRRPVINLEVNKEYFSKTRGKPKLPPEHIAGENVHNDKEFYEIFKTAVKDKDIFKEKHERLLRIIHGEVDGKASERVVKLIEKLAKEDKPGQIMKNSHHLSRH